MTKNVFLILDIFTIFSAHTVNEWPMLELLSYSWQTEL